MSRKSLLPGSEVFTFEDAPTTPRGTHKGPLNYGFLGPPGGIVPEIDDADGIWWNVNSWISRAQYLRCGPVILRHGTQALLNLALFATLALLTLRSNRIDAVIATLKMTVLLVHGCMWAGDRPYGKTPDKLPLFLLLIFLPAKISLVSVIVGRVSVWYGVLMVVVFIVRLGIPYLVGSLLDFAMKLATFMIMHSKWGVVDSQTRLLFAVAALGACIQLASNVAFVCRGACYGWYAEKERQDGLEHGPLFGFHNMEDVGDALYTFAVF